MGNGKGKGKGKGACAWDGAAGIGYVYALRAPETNTKRGRSGGGCQLLIIGRITWAAGAPSGSRRRSISSGGAAPSGVRRAYRSGPGGEKRGY